MKRSNAELFEAYLIRIKKLYKIKGVKGMSDWSHRTGIPRETLINIYEGRTTNPGILTMHKIAVGFGMSLPEMLAIPEIELLELEPENDPSDNS